MHSVGTPADAPRRITPVEARDLELAGCWVVDLRTGAERGEAGWAVPWEDDIVFVSGCPHLRPEEASEQLWPLDAA